MKKFIIVSLLVIISLIIFILTQKLCWGFNSLAENIFIGVLTSASVVLFIEIITYLKAIYRYSYFNNNFKRVEIYNKMQEPKDDKIYEDITLRYNQSAVESTVKIKHLGEGRFVGSANYEEGKVKFEIFLDSNNPSYGVGTYQYLSKSDKYKKYMPDYGKLELIRDKVDKEKIFLYYKNIAPSGLAEGYEVWERK